MSGVEEERHRRPMIEVLRGKYNQASGTGGRDNRGAALRRLLVMLDVYFDESGTQTASDVVVVAGWIATDAQWHRFSPKWTGILKAARLDPPVFHATDYEAIRSWRPEKKIRVRQRLITTIHKRTRGYTVAVVLKKPYEKAMADGVTPGIPVGAFAVLEALKKVRDWLTRHGMKHDVGYFFENRAENRGEV